MDLHVKSKPGTMLLPDEISKLDRCLSQLGRNVRSADTGGGLRFSVEVDDVILVVFTGRLKDELGADSFQKLDVRLAA